MFASRTFEAGPLRGDVSVPGDKSISHRALIAATSIRQPLRIANLNPGRDVRATIAALRSLGAHVEEREAEATVRGAPFYAPAETIDCANSGSTARMVLGACAGSGVPIRLDGDASLRRRPMEPVAAQLRAFGARIETTAGLLPLVLAGTPAVQTRNFILLAPSAQVKTALLFAGLFAGVGVRVRGDRGSRDHTERLLRFLGADIEWDATSATLGTTPLESRDLTIPGDFSSAAFFITAAATTPGSRIAVRGVGVNPTRTGLLDALGAMGAHIELQRSRTLCEEPVADISVEYAPLQAADIDEDVSRRAIDEIPLLAIAAAAAEGTTRIAGLRDLRDKESDRLSAIERLLEAVGIASRREGWRLTITGGRPSARAETIETHGDHRIAMAAAILACAAGRLTIDGAESPGVSYPGFFETLERLRTGRA